MTELERLCRGEEKVEGGSGKSLEGMTLQTVADLMIMPNNGLVIRDRWWGCKSLKDSHSDLKTYMPASFS